MFTRGFILTSLSQRLDRMARRLASQNPAVQLVAVTKYATLDQLIEAYQWGIRDFGENKIQAVLRKHAVLPPEIVQNSRWHFMGHLQRNKVKETRHNRFALIHSVDSLALAERLSQVNQADHTVQPMLLQVNITREPHKMGFLEETLLQDFPQIIRLPGIRVDGLMAMGPYPVDALQSPAYFGRVRDLRAQLVDQYQKPLPHLSMGMSEDVDHALTCGATMVRLGSGLFGDPGLNKQVRSAP